MPSLQIQHRTDYHYSGHVQLGPHRLMLRPRESRDLRIASMTLSIDPPATVTWAQDVAGNSVATATFERAADHLTIDSDIKLVLEAPAWPVYDIAGSAIFYPFQYSGDEQADLGALLAPQFPDTSGRLAAWARGFVLSNPTDTLSLLKDINIGISASIAYSVRNAEGVQSPAETLVHRSGSCRDFAVLFIEAVRQLGFGARIVSGYLHDPDGAMVGSIGQGTTHAWAEVFIPGAGWITFDPTNQSMGSANLVPVAVGRDIRQIMPVSGSFVGGDGLPAHMSVDVRVTT